MAWEEHGAEKGESAMARKGRIEKGDLPWHGGGVALRRVDLP